METTATPTPPALRPWQRLATRFAAVFVLVTLAIVTVVGALVHQRQSREVEDTVGTQLLNIARGSALLVDRVAHADAARAARADSPAYRRVLKALAAIREETLLTKPMRTLTGYDRVTRRARVAVAIADDARPGDTISIDVELETALPTLTNVRLRLSWPDRDRVSGDLSGKVTGEAAGRTRIHLTSIDPADAAVLDGMGGGDASSEAS